MSRGNPGTLARLSDGRQVIIYNSQPLIATKSKVVLTLLNEDLSIALDENKKPRTILLGNVEFDIKCSQREIVAFGKVD